MKEMSAPPEVVERYSKIIESLGFVSKGEERGHLFTYHRFDEESTGASLRVECYSESNFKVWGSLPTLDYQGPRVDPISIATSLLDKTITKRLKKYIDDYRVAYDAACEAVEKRRAAEERAKEITERVQKELGLDSRSPKIEFTAYRNPSINVTGSDEFEFKISFTGLRTPKEIATLTRLLEEYKLIEPGEGPETVATT
jgi:hypothetical protein